MNKIIEDKINHYVELLNIFESHKELLLERKYTMKDYEIKELNVKISLIKDFVDDLNDINNYFLEQKTNQLIKKNHSKKTETNDH